MPNNARNVYQHQIGICPKKHDDWLVIPNHSILKDGCGEYNSERFVINLTTKVKTQIHNLSFNNLGQWKPKSLQSYGYSNKRWVVGRAQNIQGEWHAVLLVPVNE